MPASMAGLRGERDGLEQWSWSGICPVLRSRRPYHAQAELEGRKGLRPLGFPSRIGKASAAADQDNAREAFLMMMAKYGWVIGKERKIFLRRWGFARRQIQVFLRQCPLLPPHDLRSTTRRYDEGRRSMMEVAAMPAISHSHRPIIGPVFARSELVRSRARIVLWQNGTGKRQAVSGWFSCHPTPCRATIRRSPIPGFGNSSECLPGRLPANSSKPNRSAPPANASTNRGTV